MSTLEDRAQIIDALHRYAYHFDRNEPEAAAAVFAEDAVVDYGPEVANIEGREALAATMAIGLAETFAATSHHITNPMVTVDGDDATLIAYVYAWHRYVDGSPDGHLWGQYHAKLRRTPQGWSVFEMVLKAAGTEEFHRSAMHPIGRRARARPARKHSS